MVEIQKEYAALLIDGKAYMAKGLLHSFETLMDNKPFPCQVEVHLYPFKGKIVMDGMVGYYDEPMSLSEAQRALRDYQDAEKIYTLVD